MTCCDTDWLPAQPYADEDDLLCVTCEGVDFASDTWAWAMVYASRRVYEATGGRYPGCMTSKIRPCRRVCTTTAEWARSRDLLSRPHDWPAMPYVVDDSPAPVLVNCWACRCNEDPCSCAVRDFVVLPYRPVIEVTEVLIDGEPFTDWQLQAGRLYRTDGLAWPSCNAHEPDTEVGTWSITFIHGMPLPDDARPLVAAYACELAKRACKADCELPDGVQVVSRPGIEYAVLDYVYRDQMLTGYQPLDDWILINRGGLRRALEQPRMWTMRRHTAPPTHRLETRYGIPSNDVSVTGDGMMRETLHLRDNQGLTKTVSYPARVIEAGVLTVTIGATEFFVDNATITDGVATFDIGALEWPTFPAETVVGQWDMIVKLVGGDWDAVVGGPVRFHVGVSEPVP